MTEFLAMSYSKKSSASLSKHEVGFVSTAMKDCLARGIKAKESPVKDKHLREILQLTTTEDGATGFWNWMQGKQSEQNYIMCWKFCYILHKVANEAGHDFVIQESKFRTKFLECFNETWNNHKATKRSYDALISYYSGFLLLKLSFHVQNPAIRSSLEMSEQEFYKVMDLCFNSGKDLKLLCAELLNYWQLGLSLLSTMHAVIPSDFSLDSNNIACKMQPFSVCLNECFNLYTFTRSVMYQLHTDIEASLILNLKQKFDLLFRMFQELLTNTCKWPVEAFVNRLELPKDPPKFEMVHSPDYCKINQTHFHGVLDDNIISNAPVGNQFPATAPVYGYQTGTGIPNTRYPTPTAVPHPPLPPTNVPVLDEQLLLRDLRIRELMEQNRILSQKVEYLERTSVGQVHRQISENAAIQNEKAEADKFKEELKQLKINSAQQFLHLHATIREKDELLSQMQVEKNQYELLAQMNLERLKLELQQSEHQKESHPQHLSLGNKDLDNTYYTIG